MSSRTTTKVGQSAGAQKAAAERRSARSKSTGAGKAPSPSDSGYKPPTLAQLKAMSRDELSNAVTDERAANKRAGKSGAALNEGIVQTFRTDPKNAAAIEAKAKKSTTSRATFPVIELAKGEKVYDLDRKVRCQGSGEGCAEAGKPAMVRIGSFPTTSPEKRTAECRLCRNARNQRDERSKLPEGDPRRAYVVTPKANGDTPAKANGKTTKAPAKATPAAKKAPSQSAPAAKAGKATKTGAKATKAPAKATAKANGAPKTGAERPADAPQSPATPNPAPQGEAKASGPQEGVSEANAAA